MKRILIRIMYLILIPLTTILYDSLNEFTPKVRSISFAFEHSIPFLEVFVIPYLYWFIYIIFGLLYFVHREGKKFYELLFGIIIGMYICISIYYWYPTGIARPVLEEQNYFISLVQFVYSYDNPYNCFPSLHVLDTTLVTIYLCAHGSLKVKVLALLSFVLIIPSTLFIKQHFVLDCIAAVLIAGVIYFFFRSSYFKRLCQNVNFSKVLSVLK